MTKKRAILDPSFLRSTHWDGSHLQGLINAGYSLVVCDALFYELCTTDDLARADAAFGKLRPFSDRIEVWEHVGTMLAMELANQALFGTPFSAELTETFRCFSQADPSYSALTVQEYARQCKKQREENSFATLCNCFPDLSDHFGDKLAAVRDRTRDDSDVLSACRAIVGCDDNIRYLAEKSGIGPDISSDWIVWHVLRATLALYCEWERVRKPDIINHGPKSWINQRFDTEYLVLLHWADAIASNETSGEQNAFRLWMYSDEKLQITTKNIAASSTETCP